MKWNKHTTVAVIPFDTDLVLKVEYHCAGVGLYEELYLCEKVVNRIGDVYFIDRGGDYIFFEDGRLIAWVDLGEEDYE